MNTSLRFSSVVVIGLIISVCFWENAATAAAATAEWSWAYGTKKEQLNWYTSSSSFDADIKITNEGTLPIYLAPYEIPAGYYYEGFYEFQSNLTEVVDSIILPGETSYLKVGTWMPVGEGLAPYVYIQVQPKYLEVYYFDENGDMHVSGRESSNQLQITIYDAFNDDPYDDYNPGQGVIMTDGGDASNNAVPVPGSFFLLETALILLAYHRRTN